MKIIDILNREEMTLSFEVFPPKKETSLENVRAATEKIALLKPSFMSVTYGAGGGTSNYTIDIAKNIKEKCHVPMMAHLTCISSTKEGVKKQIGAIREAGVTVPVLPGIMPITNANQVERAIKLSGSFMPQRFRSIVDRFGSDPEAMRQAGIAYATDQIMDLFANGITNIHVYSMNKPEVAAGIWKNLEGILGKKF